MRRRLAASITVLPSGTSTALPSTSSSIIGIVPSATRESSLPFAGEGVLPSPSYVLRHQTPLVLDVVPELVAVVFDESAHRHRCRIAQRTDRATLDVVSDVVQ